MNREREAGICIWAIIIIMSAVTCLCLMGCATKQKVLTEYVTVHDTNLIVQHILDRKTL